MTKPEEEVLHFEVRGAAWGRVRRHLLAGGYGVAPSEVASGRAVFWDTPEGRLGRRGLRLLLWEGRGGWSLRLVHPSGREERVAGGPGEPPASPVVDPSAWEGLRARADLLGQRPLVPLAETPLRRRTFALRSPSGRTLRAEILRPLPGRASGAAALLRISKGEGGDAASLGHLEVLLRDRAGLPAAEGDLAAWLLRREGRWDPGGEAAGEGPLRRDEPLCAAGRRLLGRQLLRLEAHAPWALRDLHPEFVHDARVAARRARTLLRFLGPALGPRRSESLRRELRWAAGLLGEVRDLDVFLAAWDLEASRLPAGLHPPTTLRGAVAREREEALDALRRGLSGRRFRDLCRRLHALADSPAPRNPRGVQAESAAEAGRRLVRRAARRALRAASALGPVPTDAELHRLRILFKRARYAGEFFREVLPLETEDFVEAAVSLQDALGAHQDAVVAVARLRRAVEGAGAPADELLAAGALLQGFWRSAGEARAGLSARLRHFRKAYRTLRRRLEGPSSETLEGASP